MRSGDARFKFAIWQARFQRAFWHGDLRTRWRISLIGLAIVLQTLLDLPRDAIHAALGPGIGLITMAVLLASIVLLFRAQLPSPLTLPRPLVMQIALALCLIAGIIGARQVILLEFESITPVAYTNDGTTLDQQAAADLLHGHDPYQTTNLIAAIHDLHQPSQYATPLRQGAFATKSWLDYPSATEMQTVLNHADPAHPPTAIESHVSYPALAFLWLVPFEVLQLPSVVLFTALCLAAFGWIALRAVAPTWRPWLGLLILADVPVLNSALAGSLDVTTLLWLFLAWLFYERPWTATICCGLALATKQQAWFFLPFFAIFLWQRLGARATVLRLGGAIALFVAVNLPFILHDAHAWTTGVLAPVLDPMFPRGQGMVQLALAGFLPLLPQRAYTILELLAYAVAVVWYLRVGARRAPELAFVLALLPLWFAWRSLTSYFYFSALPVVALWLARQYPALPASEPQPATLPDLALPLEGRV